MTIVIVDFNLIAHHPMAGSVHPAIRTSCGSTVIRSSPSEHAATDSSSLFDLRKSQEKPLLTVETLKLAPRTVIRGFWTLDWAGSTKYEQTQGSQPINIR